MSDPIDQNAAPQVAGISVNLPELRDGLDSSGQIGTAEQSDVANAPKIGLIADRADVNQPAGAAPAVCNFATYFGLPDVGYQPHYGRRKRRG